MKIQVGIQKSYERGEICYFVGRLASFFFPPNARSTPQLSCQPSKPRILFYKGWITMKLDSFVLFCFFVLFWVNFLKFYFMYLFFFIQQVLNMYSIHISVYMSIPISQFIPPTPPCFPCFVSICLFSTSVSIVLPCNPVHLYHFSRFHIYVLTYDICFSPQWNLILNLTALHWLGRSGILKIGTGT